MTTTPDPRPEAVRRAEAHGHVMAGDQPAAATMARRWTCLRCGKSALDYRGVIYGSATTDACPAAESAKGAS